MKSSVAALFLVLFTSSAFAQSVEIQFPFLCKDKDKAQKYPHIVKVQLDPESPGNAKAIIGSDKKDPYLAGGIQLPDMISMWNVTVGVKAISNTQIEVTEQSSSPWASFKLSVNLETGDALYSGIVYEINGDGANVKDYPVSCDIKIK